ncbi:MAG: Hsp20/alpha crystallin family protein [Spirochaetaceae bacterium]
MLVANGTRQSAGETEYQWNCRPRSYVTRTKDGATLLEIELPGFSVEDVELTIEQNRLTVRARKAEAATGETLIGERLHGVREAAFTLSEELDTERVDAQMKDGILTLRFDRKPERKPRQIKIKRG